MQPTTDKSDAYMVGTPYPAPSAPPAIAMSVGSTQADAPLSKEAVLMRGIKDGTKMVSILSCRIFLPLQRVEIVHSSAKDAINRLMITPKDGKVIMLYNSRDISRVTRVNKMLDDLLEAIEFEDYERMKLAQIALENDEPMTSATRNKIKAMDATLAVLHHMEASYGKK